MEQSLQMNLSQHLAMTFEMQQAIKMLQLSAHSEANLQADKAAFCQLIRILREYDREAQTVIADLYNTLEEDEDIV